MNSPTEPVSPSPSTPSSGTPPPDDAQIDALSPPASQSQGHSPSLTKRRLPAGTGPHSRDVKTRKRDDRTGGSSSAAASAIKWSISGASQGDGREAQQKKEELVDIELMEKLKNDFGDPFQSTS